jgi:serine/threonine protein kinase
MSSFKIEQDSSNYHRLEILGEGTYGKVYKVQEKSSGRYFALKCNKLDSNDQGISAVLLREISFLKSMRHPNIISLQSVILTSKQVDLVFELLRIDLQKFLESQPNGLPEDLVKSFLRQILTGLYYCQTNRVIHRDLKPQNILIDENGNVKIADFGLARCFQIPFKPYTPCVQTLWYRAPEVLLGVDGYSCAIDMWSVGCIFAEMLTKFPLFTGACEKDVLYSIFNIMGTPNEGNWPGVESFKNFKEFPVWVPVQFRDIFSCVSLDGVDLLEKMVTLDPGRRISPFDALRHVRFI